MNEDVQASPRIESTSAILDRLLQKYKTTLVPRQIKPEDMKYGFFIFGGKGVGKSVQLLMLPGTILIISMDGSTFPVYDMLCRRDPSLKDRVKIIDGRVFISETSDPDAMTELGFLTVEYILNVLRTYAGQFDFVAIDAGDDLEKQAEMKMRHIYHLQATANFSNRNFWKMRKQYLFEIFKALEKCGKKGWAISTYFELITINDKGDEVTRKIPRYVEYFKELATFEVEVESTYIAAQKRKIFEANVVSSKDERVLLTGHIYDVTDFKPLVSRDAVKYFDKPLETAATPQITEPAPQVTETPTPQTNTETPLTTPAGSDAEWDALLNS